MQGMTIRFTESVKYSIGRRLEEVFSEGLHEPIGR